MKKILIAIASLIISGCSDYDNVGEDYNMLMVCNGDAQETKDFFKNMVIGENYNKVMMN